VTGFVSLGAVQHRAEYPTSTGLKNKKNACVPAAGLYTRDTIRRRRRKRRWWWC